MTVLGIDDTDSRTEGMCTTFVGHRIRDELVSEGYSVDRTLLVRLNPAAKHKTRGNAAVAVHSDAPAERMFSVAREIIEENSVHHDDEQTNPGVVVLDEEYIPEEFASFATRTMRELVSIDNARAVHDSGDTLCHGYQKGRGIIGATAAIGAWRAMDDWTYELIQYRTPETWGTERRVDIESVFDASRNWYPDAWDTVDMEEGEPVAIPHTPCPILYGIRGDTEQAVRGLASEIEGQEVYQEQLFITNQGTDMHLQSVSALSELQEDQSFRVTATVESSPQNQRGGHVKFTVTDDTQSVECMAFEPTKRFRDHVRALRGGDVITLCGELSNQTLKLEKFAVRELNTDDEVVPTCSSCMNTMESAGKNQGYRCRDCGTSESGKVSLTIDRQLEDGWYEVPPCARRHIAKPLVRGGFDDVVHVER